MIVCRVCRRELLEECFFPSSLKKNDYICKECTKKRFEKYRSENPERIKEIAKRTRDKHKDEINRRNREYYQKIKNDPNHIAARKATYEKGKEKWQENDRARRKAFNQKYKSECAKCGENRLYLIQFHHIDPSTKSFCIGAYSTAKSEEELKAEVSKCVCLCSNCHDEFHFFYGNKPQKPIDSLKEYLAGGYNGEI